MTKRVSGRGSKRAVPKLQGERLKVTRRMTEEQVLFIERVNRQYRSAQKSSVSLG